MQTYEVVGQQFFGDDQVAQVRAGESAGVVISAQLSMADSSDLNLAFRRLMRPSWVKAAPCRARRVGMTQSKDIHAAADAFDQIIGLAYTHQDIEVCPVGKQENGLVQGTVHFRLALANGQSADGVSFEIHLGDESRRLLPEIGKDASLNDAKQGLSGLSSGWASRQSRSQRCVRSFAACTSSRSFGFGH